MQESGSREGATLETLSWLVSRQVGQSDQMILIWGAYNEAKCTVNQLITAAGTLPILQAPADEYIKITTAIKKFSAINKYLNQTYIVITADQPLYSTGKRDSVGESRGIWSCDFPIGRVACYV